jgi:hypothetical protein
MMSVMTKMQAEIRVLKQSRLKAEVTTRLIDFCSTPDSVAKLALDLVLIM